MNYRPPHISLFLLFCSLLCTCAAAQNIVGWKIMIGADAPAFIAFPSEVDNARWDNAEMNDYFRFSTRNENTMQISYNGKKDPPVAGTGFSVIQGKNTHIFTLVFKKDYDINKDPVLYYDFSDKNKLKAAAEKARTEQAQIGNDPGQAVAIAGSSPAAQQDDSAQKEARRKEEEQRKKEMTAMQQRQKKELEARQKTEAEKVRQEEKAREAEIAKARLEAQRVAEEQKKAKEAEEALAKANAAAQHKKEEEALRQKKEKEAEDQRIAREAAQQKEKERLEKDKAKAERDRLAREEAERKRGAARAEQERIAHEKQEQEEAERARQTELVRQQAAARLKAKEEAEARLLALQQEKEEARKKAQYSLAGLWERYGKKGINLYEIPPGQFAYNNTDFYIAKDTLHNYEESNSILAGPSRLDIAAAPQQDVSAALKSISFDGPIAYYRIQIRNSSSEDYLVGANILAWYNPDNSPKVFLKCSYLSYIGFFPLVKPGETRDYIYATRAANINADDHLVFTISERRPGKAGFNIFFDGSVYQQELARIARPIGTGGVKPVKEEGRKLSRKERKEKERSEKASHTGAPGN